MNVQAQLRAARADEDRELVPRVLLRAVGLLVASALAIATFARVTGMEPAAMPPQSEIVQQRALVIYGDMAGAARVFDTEGTLITDLDPTQGGFISGVWRALARVRTTYDVDIHAPLQLLRFADGRLALRDDLTGWRAELQGFGRDNRAAFARLLEE